MSNKKFMGVFVIVCVLLVAITILALTSNVFGNPMGEGDKAYSVKDGTVIFYLRENPSTGYSWHYVLSKLDIVTLVKDEYVPSPREGAIGAPGVHAWVFRAINPGTTEIAFDYYRSWEGIGASAETHQYAIIVDDALNISIKTVR